MKSSSFRRFQSILSRAVFHEHEFYCKIDKSVLNFKQSKMVKLEKIKKDSQFFGHLISFLPTFFHVGATFFTTINLISVSFIKNFNKL